MCFRKLYENVLVRTPLEPLRSEVNSLSGHAFLQGGLQFAEALRSAAANAANLGSRDAVRGESASVFAGASEQVQIL